MTIIYDLWFVREYEHREDTELRIGAYATVAEAEAVIARLREKPGFVDYPEGFQIQELTLGRTGWTEGFVTEYIPRKDPDRDASDLPAPGSAAGGPSDDAS
jgi:hypothetical protein